MRKRGRCQCHKQRSLFFALKDEASKKDQGVAQALAPGLCIAKRSRSFARSIMQTGMIALLFQTLNRIEKKNGPPTPCTRRGPVQRRTGVQKKGKGGCAGSRTKRGAVRMVPGMEKTQRSFAPLPYRVGGGAPIARVSPGFIGLGSLTTSEPVVAGGAVAVPRSGPPGAVTVPRSRLPLIHCHWCRSATSSGSRVARSSG